MSKTSYITTSIPYVNAAPHVGFALELVQADAIARYRRLCGDDVRLQSGTDENALKNVLSARARGIPVRTLVDENAARFEALTRSLDISVDSFVRTASPRHATAVTALLSRLRKEDLYTRDYRGLYCVGCEEFYDERDLMDGRCPDHSEPPTVVAEENVFFRLTSYASVLHQRIASRELHIVPVQREREVLRFIERGLHDLSISRDARRSEHWGIPFPGAPSQIVYVWIDALINYLTGLGFPDGDDVSRYWCADTCHVIGKNVWKFHAVYWPALLLSAGLPLPKQIVVHGFVTENGRKISKSSGETVDPSTYVQRFGAEALRYFLLRHVRPFDDSDFSEARLAASYEADLANGLGNLVSRLTALCESANVRGASPVAVPDAPSGFHEHLQTYQFDLALDTLWAEIASLNREIATAKPWEVIKAGDLTSARQQLWGVVERLAATTYWLAPFLPATSRRIRDALCAANIQKAEPLFPRVEKRVR